MDIHPPPRGNHPAAGSVLSERSVCVTLYIWLLLAVPLYVGMPLNCDTALYDVQARTVLNGGTAYRDIIEPNLPGVLWIHLAIRTTAGWSSEAMRMADLLILGTILWLWSGVPGRDRGKTVAVLLSCTFFYLTCNAWCHAQRDTWMLLPAGLAVILRKNRQPGSRDQLAVLEGFCWGCAFWIKPHVIVPAAAVVLVDLLRGDVRTQIRDTGAVVFGGLLAALPGIAWLVATGAWEHFWDMMLNWNPEYLKTRWSRMSLAGWVKMGRVFAPWPLIHLIATPLAVTALNACRQCSRNTKKRGNALLGGAYLGWLLQAFGLQHMFHYVHVPGIILGLTVICCHPFRMSVIVRRANVAAFVAFAVMTSPFFRLQSLRQWPIVLAQGSTADVRSALAQSTLPDWQHLAQVIQFLNKQHVDDGEVTCLNANSVQIYRETQTRPSTRYWSISLLQRFFPQRAGEISEAVCVSGHRYVVTESTESRLIPSTTHHPWLEQLTPVFESGTYCVLEVNSDQRRGAIEKEPDTLLRSVTTR